MAENTAAKAENVESIKYVSVVPGRFKNAEFARVVYQVVPTHGTPYEALFKADYWAHVAAQLKPMDKIEVVAEDGSYYAELIVLGCSRTWAKVSELRHVSLASVTPVSVNEEYKVEWSGPHTKWRVLRLSDKTVVAKDFTTEDEAQAWKREHLKAMAA